MHRLLFILLIPVSLFGQNTIKGKVLNSADNAPIAGASAFLSNSSVGSSTQTDGSYMLSDVKNGQYDMVVSCVGFETYHHRVAIYNGDIVLPDISLVPRMNVLNEVKIVSSKNSANQKKYLSMFLEAFFGTTKNAAECKLLNPELLDFDFDPENDRLSATSSNFLIIENKALGYRIKYLLASFSIDPGQHIISYSGSFVFEQLNGSGSQKRKWKQKRVKAYLGSEMHFLRSCIADQVDEEYFTVRKLVRTAADSLASDSVIYANIKKYSAPSASASQLNYWIHQSQRIKYDQKLYEEHLDSHDFIRVTNIKGVYGIGYPYCLVINYCNRRSKSLVDNTIITFTQPFAYFDSNGIIINPLSNKVEGYWGTLRIADLLPVDYDMTKN